jgi:hypothetical protein
MLLLEQQCRTRSPTDALLLQLLYRAPCPLLLMIKQGDCSNRMLLVLQQAKNVATWLLLLLFYG